MNDSFSKIEGATKEFLMDTLLRVISQVRLFLGKAIESELFADASGALP